MPRKRKTAARHVAADVITARLPTIPTVVHGAITPGTVDRVERVKDPVLAMRRRRVNPITAEQYEAAETYREIYDAVRAGPGGSLDPSKICGGGFGSRAPGTYVFDCALRLREATRVLNAIPVPLGATVNVTVIIEMIVGQNWTIEGAAQAIPQSRNPGGRASGRNRALVAGMFRAGLDALVDLWFRSAQRRAGNGGWVR